MPLWRIPACWTARHLLFLQGKQKVGNVGGAAWLAAPGAAGVLPGTAEALLPPDLLPFGMGAERSSPRLAGAAISCMVRPL